MIIPEIIDLCNLKCSLCWNRNRKGTGKQMPLSTVEKVLDIFGTGRRTNLHWYSWGEPLRYKQFHEFINVVEHTRSSISTNFSLKLTDQHFKDFPKLEQLTISMSGLTQEVYNVYHRGGNFSLVMENVNRLINSERPQKVRINWLMHPWNKHQTQQAMDWCEENNFIWGGLRGNCEVEEMIETDGKFTSPFMKTPRYYSSKRFENCKVQRWIPISVDGEYLTCCTSHNVGLGVTLWDNITQEELLQIKRNSPLCKQCYPKGYWRMF